MPVALLARVANEAANRLAVLEIATHEPFEAETARLASVLAEAETLVYVVADSAF